MKRIIICLALASMPFKSFAQPGQVFTENTYKLGFTNPELFNRPLQFGPFDVDRWTLTGNLIRCTQVTIPPDPATEFPRRLDPITTCLGIADQQGVTLGRFESLGDPTNLGAKRFKLDVAFATPYSYRQLEFGPSGLVETVVKSFKATFSIKLQSPGNLNPQCTSAGATTTFVPGLTTLVYEADGTTFRTLNVTCVSPVRLVEVEGDQALVQKLELTKGVRVCSVATAGRTVPFWAQGQAPWGSQNLAGVPDKSMAQFGCAVTSLAMLARSYGLTATPELLALNPGNLNSALSAKAPGSNSAVGFAGPAVRWPEVARIARLGRKNQCIQEGGTSTACTVSAQTRMAFKRMISNGTVDLNYEQATRVENEICGGNPVVLELRKKSDLTKQHFVLATAFEYVNGEKNFVVNDPGQALGQRLNFSAIRGKYSKIVGFRLYRPSLDPSILHFWSSANVDMVLTDTNGRRVGHDPVSGISYDEIEGAGYALHSVNTPAEPEFADEVLSSQNELMLVENVIAGQYRLEIIGKESGPYNVEVLHTDLDGNPNDLQTFSGNIFQNESRALEIPHSIETLPEVNADLQIKKEVLSPVKLCRHKKDRHIGDVFDIEVRGKLDIGKKLTIQSKVELVLGSTTAFRRLFAAADFKRKNENKKTKYELKDKHGNQLFLDSEGNFELSFHSVDFGEVSQSSWGYMLLNVDDRTGADSVILDCKRNKCTFRGH